ncbi:hypothetical protein EDB19DRAFT_1180690 [Suillus lakei]|nr:hypothetical protein EDB19DRAFT_1180690 [Suillus lakei]
MKVVKSFGKSSTLYGKSNKADTAAPSTIRPHLRSQFSMLSQPVDGCRYSPSNRNGQSRGARSPKMQRAGWMRPSDELGLFAVASERRAVRNPHAWLLWALLSSLSMISNLCHPSMLPRNLISSSCCLRKSKRPRLSKCMKGRTVQKLMLSIIFSPFVLTTF